MKIERVVLRTLRLRLKGAFRTSGGVTRDRTVLLVHVHGDGLEGVGECVAGETPHYSAETTETARWVLEHHLVPAVLGTSFERAAELGGVLERAARGHRMARASLEMAAWDAEARAAGVSLAVLLGGERQAVEAGVSLGIQDDLEVLLDQVTRYLEQGYRRIKLKIEPGRDVDVLDAVRKAHPEILLTVDANTAYDPDRDMDRLVELDRYELLYIEQPFGRDELVAHARLQQALGTPICLDESIESPGDCRTALALDACGVINIKPGRVGGHGPARQIHDLCADAGVPVWCGGMLESGVGRAHNVALASLPNMTLPGDVSASDRYWDRDIVVPPFRLRSDGSVEVPTGPGIGVELDEDFIRSIEVDRQEWGR